MRMLDFKDLISDDMIQEMLLPFAIEYLINMSKISTEAINTFYGSYDPILYKRGMGLSHMWEGEMTPIPKGYSATMAYDSAFFSSSHRSDEHVFNGPFLQGYHGGPLAWGHPRNVPQTSPSPYEIIEQYWASYDI